jgi:cytochrome P450
MRRLGFLAADFDIDPWPTYAELRRTRPVWYAESIGMLCTFGYAETKHVLTSGDYTVQYPFRISEQVFGRTLLDMDGEEHGRLRAPALRMFTRANVARMIEAVVEPVTASLLRALAGREELDFMADVADRLPVQVICRLLGVDVDRVEAVRHALDCLLRHLDGSQGDFEVVSATRVALERHLQEALEGWDGTPETASLVPLARALPDSEGRRMMMLMLAAGVETSVCGLGNTLSTLLRHPPWLDKARGAPEQMTSIVTEALRWEPPQHDTVRFARADAVLGGVPVRAGQPVKVILASANRDERTFVDAERFVPGRESPPLMSFGYGPHMCVGRILAVMEIEHVFRRLLGATSSIESDPSVDLRPVGNTFRRPPRLPMRVRWARG